MVKSFIESVFLRLGKRFRFVRHKLRLPKHVTYLALALPKEIVGVAYGSND